MINGQRGSFKIGNGIPKQIKSDQHLISSIYFGGGTPSLVPIPLLEKIISRLPKDPNTEITIEMNPEDVTQEILKHYHDIGINRLSIGIQTFHPKHAKLLRRSHTAQQAHDIIQIIKEGPIKLSPLISSLVFQNKALRICIMISIISKNYSLLTSVYMVLVMKKVHPSLENVKQQKR